jgi:hypothetical protein
MLMDMLLSCFLIRLNGLAAVEGQGQWAQMQSFALLPITRFVWQGGIARCLEEKMAGNETFLGLL